MKVTSSTKLIITTNMTAGELSRVLGRFPADAKISVTKEKYYDQRDPGQTYITVVWSEEK